MSRCFKEIYLKQFGMVFSKTCDMVFSTDMYHPDSVQSIEKHKGGSGDKLIIKSTSTKKPKNLKAFLSYDGYKLQPIKPILNVSQMNLTTTRFTN